MSLPPKNILVVGYGIAGRCLAYRLVQKGYQVQICHPEPTDKLASFAAQGVSAIKGLVFARSNLFGLKIKGHYALLRLLKELSEKTGKKLFEQGPVFEPFVDEDEKNEIFRRIYKNQFHQIFHKELLSKEDLGKYLQVDNRAGAFHFAKDFVYDPLLLLEVLDEEIRKSCDTFIQEKVVKMEVNDGTKVYFESHEKTYDHVFLCAGTQTQTLLKNSSLPFRKDRRIAGVTAKFSSHHVALREDMALIFGKSSICRFGEHCFAGSSSASLSSKSEQEAMEEGKSEMRSFINEALGQNVQTNSMKLTWRWGVRSCYENMLPQIERLKRENVHFPVTIVSGLYKNGYQLAPWAAENLCENL